jgi:hypothetical protein
VRGVFSLAFCRAEVGPAFLLALTLAMTEAEPLGFPQFFLMDFSESQTFQKVQLS